MQISLGHFVYQQNTSQKDVGLGLAQKINLRIVTNKYIPKELIYYIFKICEEKKFCVTTKFHSVEIFIYFIEFIENKFLSNDPDVLSEDQKNLKTKIDLQLYALTSLLIISKFIEINPLTLTECHYYSDQNFTRRHILLAEQEILVSIGFDLISVGPTIPDIVFLLLENVKNFVVEKDFRLLVCVVIMVFEIGFHLPIYESYSDSP